MSSSDEEEEGDSLSEIDFSVISTSIKLGGTVVNQIVNSINYGSPEVRYLLQEECDVIIECKVCRNLFRSIPMFVAHKRIYCQEFSASSKDNAASSPPEEQVVVVQPESADVPREGEGQQKSTVDQLLAGTFHGTSEAYKLYTKHAQRVETQKTHKTVSTINVTEIPTNPNAVQISVQRNIDNQSDSVLQNGLAADDGSTQVKKNDKVNDSRSELMKELSKKIEKSPDFLKEKLEKLESNLNLDSQKGNGLNKNIELRPVKSQDATVCELRELENMGHCDIKKVKCLICKVTFVAKKGLLQHMHSQHSGKKTIYPCHMCKSKFKYFWGLTRHLKSSHEKTKEQIDRIRGKLRANAYTISVDSEHNENMDTNEKEEKSVSSQTEAMEIAASSINSESSKKVARTPGGITLNKCGGCGKAFWKRQSYDEHTKQCKWVAPTSNSHADNLRHKQVKENDLPANTDNKTTITPGKNQDKNDSTTKENESKTKEKSKKESPTLADSQKAVPERFIRTRSESMTRGHEVKTRSGSSESRNSSRSEKFTQENRSRSGNTGHVAKNRNSDQMESVKSESRDRSNDSSSKNEKFTQENRSRSERDVPKTRTSSGGRSDSSRSASRDRKGSVSSDITEKQMVTRNIATRRGESERKPVVSKTTTEKSLNRSRKSEESVQDSDSETMSINSGTATSNIPRRIGTRSSDVSCATETDEVDGSGKKESTSPSSKINRDHNVEVGSKKGHEVNSIEASRKYLSTRRSVSQKSKDLQSQVSSRNSSVERDQVSGTRKMINTNSSDDAANKIHDESLKNSDSNCVEADDTQTLDETASGITTTGNTYIIDGVEISEVTEAQINARKDKIDHQNDFDDLDDVISDTASESKHYLRSSQKENTKTSNTESRLSSSSENLHLDIDERMGDKTERSSSSERRPRTSSALSQKQSPNLKSSGVEKKSMDSDEVLTKITSVSTMTHVLRSHDKADGAKNKDIKQALSPSTPIDNPVFDPNMEMLEAQETINTLQNFPNIQMITRRSLETFRPKDEDVAEEKSDDVPAPAMATRKSERQKSHAIDQNKNQESSVNESQKSTAQLKKSTKEESTFTTIYVCIFCPKEFSYYWGLTRHLRINHHKSKQQIPLLWNKLKAKSYTINKKTDVKRINKTGPIKVESGKTKTGLRQSKNTNDKSKNVSSVKTRDNMYTRSQLKGPKAEPTSGEKLTPNTRKSVVKTGEINTGVGNRMIKISPKSESVQRSAVKSLKSPASGVKSDSKMHDCEPTTPYNTRKSVDHLVSSNNTPTDSLSTSDNVSDETTSEKIYTVPEINSNSNKVCIEEIWVGKEPGQPSKSIRCQKVIIESESGKSLLSKMTVRRRKSQVNSPKSKEKGTRKMYVVDPGKSSQPRCLDSKRVDALICENHTTAEQFCLQCGMVFSNVSNLRRHIVRHLGWKRYKCKLCSFASYNKSECSTHLRRIHTEKLLGGSVQSYVIDLNKEASKLRTEKKQNTMSLRKTDSTSGTTSCKSYWYRDRNAKRVPLKISNSSRGDIDLGDSENADESSNKKKKTVQKKNEDRRKPGVNVKNIKQIPSSSKYNISTRNSSRTFDTSPYKEMNEMETLMTRQGHYPKDEKISLRSKRDILSDIDNENVLPKQNLKSSPSSQLANDSQISKANSGSDTVVPVVRKRKRSDSEGHNPQEVEEEKDNEMDTEIKTSPSGSKSKEVKQNEAKWKLKRSFSHDGIPSSQVSNEESDEFSSNTDGGQVSKLEKKYSELRQAEADVRLTPSLKTMMAALEEARATIKKRRRPMKRSVSPVKKIQRLSSVDATCKDRFRRHSLDVMVSKTGTTDSDVNLDNESVDENVNDDEDDNGDDDGGRVQNVNQMSADNEINDDSKFEIDEKEEGNHDNKTLQEVDDSQKDITEKTESKDN